jgi:hypothetical protein
LVGEIFALIGLVNYKELINFRWDTNLSTLNISYFHVLDKIVKEEIEKSNKFEEGAEV